MKDGKPGDVTSYWPEPADEDVLVCVFKGDEIDEPFRRQDFFFLNYTYKNSYQGLSSKYNNLITIHENECYIAQPYSGYALRKEKDDMREVVIIGKREEFFKKVIIILLDI